jgi:membrane associated rhomboid family serine protease
MFLLPVGQEDNTLRRLPWISVGILLICIAMQIYASSVETALERELTPLLEERFRLELQLKAGQLGAAGDPRLARYQRVDQEIDAVIARLPAMQLGYKPAEGGVRNMLTSIFAHAGWLHLIGNMWFLYLVGCKLEDRWGAWQFLAFYLVAGCLAARAFGELHPGSTVPLIGASGAVAGAMGAFLVCHARTRMIFHLYVLVIKVARFRVPAWVVLGLWLAEQVSMTFVEARAGSPVAYSAHAAGFAFGTIVALMLRATGADEALDRASAQAAEGPGWEAHPGYVRAMEARDRSDNESARAFLHDLLRDTPDHAGGHETLLDLYFEQKIPTAELFDVDLSLPFLIDHYQRAGMDEALVALYRRLRHQLPAYGLTDQELLRVATAAHHRKENALVVTAVTEMMTEHPASTALPRALLLAAEVQARSGAPDLQRDTLQRIAEKFPEHACAKLARDELARIVV